MDPHRNEPVVAMLREMRPLPQQRFAAELDARVAAGFPRQPGRGLAALARPLSRLRAMPPRRLIATAGAAGLAAIVVATAVVAGGEGGHSVSGGPPSQPFEPRAGGAAVQVAPSTGAAEGAGAVAGSAESAGSAIGEEAAPTTTPGPYAVGRERRDVERSARIVLGAKPSQVREEAGRVFDAVHAVDGIVLRSQVRDGAAGVAGAEFELLVPSARVSDALATISAIGEVRSRRESSLDITGPTARAEALLKQSNERIDSLLQEYAGAGSTLKREAIERQLERERRRATELRSRRADLHRRARLSHVFVRIETDRPGHRSGAGAGWGIDDGLHAAGRILAVAAGVTIVGLALLAPFALLALLGWLGRRTWLRAARARAL